MFFTKDESEIYARRVTAIYVHKRNSFTLPLKAWRIERVLETERAAFLIEPLTLEEVRRSENS